MCISSVIEIIVLYRLGSILEYRRRIPFKHVGRLKNQYFHFKQYCTVVSTLGPTCFECICTKNVYNRFQFIVPFLLNDVRLVQPKNDEYSQNDSKA